MCLLRSSSYDTFYLCKLIRKASKNRIETSFKHIIVIEIFYLVTYLSKGFPERYQKEIYFKWNFSVDIQMYTRIYEKGKRRLI